MTFISPVNLKPNKLGALLEKSVGRNDLLGRTAPKKVEGVRLKTPAHPFVEIFLEGGISMIFYEGYEMVNILDLDE